MNGLRDTGLDLSVPARKVLLETMEREILAPFEWAEAGPVMDKHGLSAAAYRKAVESLLELGVVTADTTTYHRSGFARTRLDPAGFLRIAASELMPEVDVAEEMEALLEVLRDTDEERVVATDALEAMGIPLGRFDLYARALRDAGLLDGTGPASARFGSFRTLGLTAKGRRVVEGEEALPLP